MIPQRREPKGTTGGGQFAGMAHAAAPIRLSAQAAPAEPDSQETMQLTDWLAARDPHLDPRAVADLMDHRRPTRVRHDTVNRGGAVVLTLAAGDPEPVIRAAAVGSPLIPSQTRYALRRDVVAVRLTHPRLAHAS